MRFDLREQARVEMAIGGDIARCHDQVGQVCRVQPFEPDKALKLEIGGRLVQPPPFAFPLTHLWFLYVLTIFYVVSLAVRGLVARFDTAGRIRALADRVVGWLVRLGLAPALLALPLVALVGSLGLPVLGNFIAEFLVLMGALAATVYVRLARQR